MQLTSDIVPGIIGISIFSYVLIGFFIESIKLIIDVRNNIYLYNNKQHSIEHIVCYITYFIGNSMLLFGTFNHNGFEHGFNVHIIEGGLGYTIIVLGVSGLALLTHIRKERKINF